MRGQYVYEKDIRYTNEKCVYSENGAYRMGIELEYQE